MRNTSLSNRRHISNLVAQSTNIEKKDAIQKDAIQDMSCQIPSLLSGYLRSISRTLFLATASSPALAHDSFSLLCPSDAIVDALKKAWNVNSISIQDDETISDWIEPQAAQKLASQPEFELYSFIIEGKIQIPFYVTIPVSLYRALANNLLGESAAHTIISRPQFFSRFRSFIISQAVSALRDVQQLSSFGISLRHILSQNDVADHFTEPNFTHTVHLEVSETNFDVTCLFSSSFMKEWQHNVCTPSFEKNFSSITSAVALPVSIEIGRTFLLQKELSQLHTGDVLVIDFPFYTPKAATSRVFLTYQGKPIFKAKYDATVHAIKILNMPFQHEVFTYTGKKIQPKMAPIMSDIGPQQRKEESTTKNDADKDEGSGDNNSSSSTDQLDEGQKPNMTNTIDSEKSLPHEEEIDLDDNPFEGDEEEEDDDDNDDNGNTESHGRERQPQQDNKHPDSNQSHSNTQSQEVDTYLQQESKKYLPPEKIDFQAIPHTVVVQLTQLQMTLESLSKLSTGNVIELPMQPQNYVSLVINDTVFAIGELVVIEDHIGVRIKEVGF